MALSVVGNAAATITASRSPSVTIGSWTPAAGDIVVMWPSSTGITVTVADVVGWVNVLGSTVDVESDSHELCCVLHTVTGAEAIAGTTTYTATNLWSVAQTGNVCAAVVRGGNPSAPIDSAASTFSSTNTVTPSVLAALVGTN